MLQSLLENPMEYLTQLVLRLPAVLIAICMHESAHGWVANRCGDPTARLMGRITLNPVKHFDPAGMLCLVFFGVGWAKPVPINPLHFRNYRKDDLKVSLAGVTMNLILALVFLIPTYAVFTRAFVSFREMYLYYYYLPDGARACYEVAMLNPSVIVETWGAIPGYLYEMLANVVVVNLSLAIFNLIPLPPLDGYHVLNDLVLRRSLYASSRAGQIGYVVMLVLLFSGLLSEALGFVTNGAFAILGNGAGAILSALGVL